MKEETFKVSCPELDWSYEASYQFGETAEESIQQFGDEPVNDGFIANAKVYLQNVGRAAKRAGKDDAGVQAEINAAKPGVKRARVAVDPKAALLASIGTMSDDEKLALLAEMKDAAGM